MTWRTLAALLLIAAAACSTDSLTGQMPASTTQAMAPTTTLSDEGTGGPTTSTPALSEPELEFIGGSRGGRPLEAATVGDGPVRVYVVGSIHGDERTAVETSRALLDHVAQTHPAGVTIRWLLDANPDGSARRDRDNAAEVDLNRNWPTNHFPSDAHGNQPMSEPETIAVAADIAAFEPDVIIAMHSAREGPFVNYDGPGEELAGAFASGASVARTWEVLPTVDWPTPGSLGTHYGGLGVPVITVEGNRWDTPVSTIPELTGGLDTLLAVAAGLPAPAHHIECADHLVGNSCSDLTRQATDLIHSQVSGGTTGFILKEAGGPVLAARWADHPFYPASSIKALHHLQVVLAGEGALGAPVTIPADSCTGRGSVGTVGLAALDRLMMLESDNEATNAIQHHFGLEALQETADDAGMVDTGLHHGFGCGGPSNDPANVSTAADLMTLYERVGSGTLLDSEQRDRFVAGMLDITAEVEADLGSALREGVTIVAKGGWYDRSRSIGGIAFTDGTAYVFAAFADRPLAYRDGFTLEELVALLIRDLVAAEQ